MSDFPKMIAPIDHVEPVPRRVRARLANEIVFDTNAALYVWEWPYYPQYYVPIEDVNRAVLVDEKHTEHLRRGTAELYGLKVGGVVRPRSARLYKEIDSQLFNTVRFDWE